ncbi:MAG: hypothetical protein OEX12_11665 [Gammaproteobacteria bacterium]|nr:hypothetical protein [Gammaproteobacteria bacterium]
MNMRQMAVSYHRSRGLSFRSIYNALIAEYGPEMLPDTYDERFVWKDFQAATNKVAEETQDYVRTYWADQMAKIEQLLEVVMPKALEGDGAAFDRTLKALNYQAKLLRVFELDALSFEDPSLSPEAQLTENQMAARIQHLLQAAMHRKEEGLEVGVIEGALVED